MQLFLFGFVFAFVFCIGVLLSRRCSFVLHFSGAEGGGEWVVRRGGRRTGGGEEVLGVLFFVWHQTQCLAFVFASVCRIIPLTYVFALFIVFAFFVFRFLFRFNSIFIQKKTFLKKQWAHVSLLHFLSFFGFCPFPTFATSTQVF